MTLNINNPSVNESLNRCIDELNKIEKFIESVGPTAHPVPYLTRYSIIRACGAIEHGFKTLISDIHSDVQTPQLKNFIDTKFRNSSMNPSYDNIIKSLDSFDENWKTSFLGKIKALPHKDKTLDALKSLNQARNAFAHGNIPTTSFSSIKDYFEECVTVLKIIEESIA